MSEPKWCEHLVEIEDSSLWDKSSYRVMFCPICGAKRPEPEKKKLWEKFYYDVKYKASDPFDLKAKLYANTAIEAVEEVIDKCNPLGLPDFFVVSVDELKKKLRELL